MPAHDLLHYRLKKSRPSPVDVPRTTDEHRPHTGPPRIRCPRCAWAPRRDARWSCSCRHEWHTFDTGGVCPACQRVWAQTQCPKCNAWSPHADWYELESRAQ